MGFNPYDVLGVGADATDDEINAAYKRRAKETHPDAGGDAKEFQALSHAVAILRDAERRKKFDNTGETDDGIDHTRNKAWHYLADILGNVIVKHENPHRVNLLSEMGKIIKDQLREIPRQEQLIENAIAKIEKLQKRFKRRKEGDNVFESIIADQLNELRGAFKTLERDKRLREEAQKLLHDYDFDVEKMEEQYFSLASMSFSTEELEQEMHERSKAAKGFFSGAFRR